MNYHIMLYAIDEIITTAPEYEDSALVGFPINAILVHAMATPAGFAMFTNEKVNEQFKRIFDVWVEYLVSPQSRYVLNHTERGWFGPLASEKLPDFDATWKCEPDQEHKGFKSWDDFFTREFREGERPVYAPDDDSIITSACESQVYNIQYKVSILPPSGEEYSPTHPVLTCRIPPGARNDVRQRIQQRHHA